MRTRPTTSAAGTGGAAGGGAAAGGPARAATPGSPSSSATPTKPAGPTTPASPAPRPAPVTSRRRPDGRAVVIGGSFAGMMAAAALSATVGQVTLVERHPLPSGPYPRQGVPQARHTHLLWSGGVRAAEELLPGLTDRLLAAGARRLAVPSDMVVMTSGGWLERFPGRQFVLACTRDLLDWVVRDMVGALPGVRLLPGTTALGLRGTVTRVAGVAIRTAADAERVLEADLVVDAAGRSSSVLRWLERLGMPPVPIESVDPGVGYATRLFRAPDGAEDFPAVNIHADPRTGTPGRTGLLLPVEDGRWVVTLAGTRGDTPTGDPAAFEEYARGMRHPVIGELIARAEPLGDVTLSHSTVNLRRRFERMRDWPEGLIVLGDALAVFNPLYGQGMSVAARHAVALRRETLRSAGPGLSRRVQRAAARAVSAAWTLASAQDLRYPGTIGERPPLGSGVRNHYVDRVMASAGHRKTASRALFDVVSLTYPLTAFARPHVAVAALAPTRIPPGAEPPFTAEERAAVGLAAPATEAKPAPAPAPAPETAPETTSEPVPERAPEAPEPTSSSAPMSEAAPE